MLAELAGTGKNDAAFAVAAFAEFLTHGVVVTAPLFPQRQEVPQRPFRPSLGVEATLHHRAVHNQLEIAHRVLRAVHPQIDAQLPVEFLRIAEDGAGLLACHRQVFILRSHGAFELGNTCLCGFQFLLVFFKRPESGLEFSQALAFCP